MKCYYEELGIEREADEKEIKNAYRKLALRFHPDKNPDAQEEAKERFQLIQQAYEVLSDPQERAFYDKHREQILRGKNSNYEDNTLDLFQYFTISCFKGYGDDVKGFYAVYREVFKKIAAEDAEFMDDHDELEDIPEFGDSQSTYEDVVGPFYAYWQSYCTKKTYTWLCPYDIQEVKDRRVLRAIDKEMKKVVQNAKKERNEEVRSLVSFVRKRDKRVQAYNRQLEERAALNRKKQEQNRHEQLLRRQREIEEMRLKGNETLPEGYEEQLKQLEQEYGADTDSSSTDDEDDESGNEEEENEYYFEEEFFCVACTKAFKNQNAFDNHALSKKHRENEERLKLEMLEEEETLSNMKINSSEEHEESVDDGESVSVEKLENSEGVENDGDDDDVEKDDHNSKTNSKKNKKGKKSKKNISKIVEKSDDESIDASFVLPQESDKSDDGGWSNSNKNKKSKKSKKNISKIVEKSDDESIEASFVLPQESDKSDDGDWSNSNKNKKSKKSKKNVSKIVEKSDDESIDASFVLPQESDKSDDGDWSNSNKKNNRKNQNKKQTKKSGKDRPCENGANIEPSLPQPEEVDAADSSKRCVTCNAVFDSKNKLFAHLKKTNHGVYISKGSIPSGDSTKTKSKGKRK